MCKTELPSYYMLIVEDDPEICTGLQDFFALKAYDTTVARDGEEALEKLRQKPDYDIVLLDLMLPKKSGFDVLRESRALGIRCPVLMLTARGEQEMILQGFDLGIADYVVKPFNAELLAARVRAILSRTLPPSETPMEVYRFGDIEVNFSSHEVSRGDEAVHLTTQEFNLLHYLLQNRGRTVTRTQLLRDAWGITGDLVTRTIDRHMASLRKKIEPDPARPAYIETIYGRGYRFKE